MAVYYKEKVEQPWPPWDSAGYRMARGLGWFSLALGAAELLAPRSLARWLGMENKAELIRLYGLREIVSGVGILSQDDPTAWVWARVGGDALDLATLAPAYREDNPQRENVGIALAAVAGAALLDVVCAQQLSTGRPELGLLPDYSDRSGLPRSPDAMRGVARDLDVPRDMRIPEAMRPYARA
jgi:hypothetical protein